MKNTILPALLTGLLLAGCNRTASQKYSSNDQSDASKTPYSENATPTATSNASNSSAMASNSNSPSPDMTNPALTSNSTSTTNAANTDMASNDQSTISNRITEWRLKPDEIKDELQTSGRVVRSRKAGAGEPTGPMGGNLVGEINGKFQADANISKLNLNVSADKGVVTLDGSAHSLDQIGRAIALALDTGGVSQVVSTVKLDTAP